MLGILSDGLAATPLPGAVAWARRLLRWRGGWDPLADAEGPPVLLLHSGGMSGRQWRRLAALLSPSYRVVVPDLLGSGANPPWPAGAPFDLALDLAELAELLESLRAPAHVVGHSYGGLLGLKLASERPASV